MQMRVEKFTARFSDTPKLVRILNVALPASMIVAVLFGGVVIAWQIASLAHEGEVRISLPSAEPAIAENFPVEVVFKAQQARDPLHLVFKLDDQVINAKVTGAFSNGEVQKYVFSSGDNGVNLFDRNLLKPGKHTVQVEAYTGDAFGQGAHIDTDKTEFSVKNVKNIVAFDEGIKTLSASQLPIEADKDPRSALLMSHRSYLQDLLMPRASAHTSSTNNRHGDLAVSAPPGIGITIKPVASVLGDCHQGNTRTADGAGKATFTACPVSNSGQSSAGYIVTLGETPAGWTLTDGRGHQATVEIFDDNRAAINFAYAVSAKAPEPTQAAPTPTTAPVVPPPASVTYDYAPDSVPFIALTKLGATTAEVDAFAYQLVNNAPANYLQEISADLDGTRVSTRTDLNNHATHAGVTLGLPNIQDGKPHDLTFRAVSKKGKVSTVSVKLTADNGTGGASAPTGASGTSSPTPVPAVPTNVEDGGDGRIKVTTRIYKDGSAKDRIGNSEVVVQAKDHAVDQVVNGKLLNCNPYKKITNQTKDSDGYGQVTFDGCWTSKDKKQNYIVKQVTPPNGYSVRSLHLPSDPGRSLGINDPFEVKDGQEIAVDIWLNPPPEAAPNGGSANAGQPGAPAVPGNLRLSETAVGEVTLAWDAVPGVAGYAIEKLDLSKPDPASAWDEGFGDNSNTDDDNNPITPATTYLDNTAGIATRNVYRIAAYTYDNNDDPVKSGYAQAEITTAPLGAPTKLTLSQPAIGKVKLVWQAPATAVPGYVIQRSTNGTDWSDIATNDNTDDDGNTIAPATTYLDEGDDVKFSTHYFYRVASTDDDDMSAFATAEITTAPVPPPKDLKLKEKGPAVLQLDWQEPADIGDIIVAYVVERSTDQVTWEKRADNVDEAAYTDLEGLFATHYFYRIATKIDDSVSVYVVADITTKPFVPNITPAAANKEEANAGDEETSPPEEEDVTDDELDQAENYEQEEGTNLADESGESAMEAFVPKDALSQPTSCDVVKVDGRDGEISEDVTAAAEPSALVCKTADGAPVESFDKPVVLIFNTDSEGAEDKQIFSLAASKVVSSRLKSGGGAGGRVLSATKKPGIFALVNPIKKKGVSPFYIIAGVTAVLIGAATTWVVVRHRMESKFSAPPDPDI